MLSIERKKMKKIVKICCMLITSWITPSADYFNEVYAFDNEDISSDQGDGSAGGSISSNRGSVQNNNSTPSLLSRSFNSSLQVNNSQRSFQQTPKAKSSLPPKVINMYDRMSPTRLVPITLNIIDYTNNSNRQKAPRELTT